MKRSDQVLLGLFITLVGVALMAPNETSKVVSELGKVPKSEIKVPKSEMIEPAPAPLDESKTVKSYGVIRRSFFSTVSGIKKFWKWLY